MGAGRSLKIAVAGCGPAGLGAALFLARDGHDVTLFDRFEAPRPLGSGLMIQPTGLAVLDELGLGGAIRATGARVDRLFGKAAPSGRTVLDVRYAALGRQAGFGLGVHRASLFDLLHAAVLSAGLPLCCNQTINGSAPFAHGRRVLVLDANRTAPFDLVVDALGCNTPLAPPTGRTLAYGALWASLDWPAGLAFDGHALEQRYEAASTMVGVLPIGSVAGLARPQAAFFWSLRCDRLEAWRAEGLESWKARVATIWPETTSLLDQIVSPSQLTFARYTHRTIKRPVGEALVHIGDSWHSTSPQLGQGANMALLDAYALALALRGAADVPTALNDYVRLRQWHVRLYQTMSAAFTPVYQSDGRALPFIRDRLVGPLSRLWPADWIQAAMVSGLVGGPLKPLGLEPATDFATLE